MSTDSTAKVGIVGAGSIGILTGYHLIPAGRQGHLPRLPLPPPASSTGPRRSTPTTTTPLKHYTGYDVFTDPAELSGKVFDVVLVTLDGAGLRAEAGQRLIEELGRGYRGTSTQVP
ncbi:hypothetical protein ACQPZJ_17015 [Actinoplanes sp. CA-054009]